LFFGKAMETGVTEVDQFLAAKRLVCHRREKSKTDLQQKRAIRRDKAARLETTKFNSIPHARPQNLNRQSKN
jgi:DNA-binding Xre family transcriptional regulator